VLEDQPIDIFALVEKTEDANLKRLPCPIKSPRKIRAPANIPDAPVAAVPMCRVVDVVFIALGDTES